MASTSAGEVLPMAARLSDSELIDYCSKEGHYQFNVLLKPHEPITLTNPYSIKKDIQSKINNTNAQLNLIKTRAGSIIAQNTDKNTAEKLLKVTNIFGTKVTAKLLEDNLISSYVVKGVENGDLNDIILDFEEQKIKIHRILRFTKKTDEGYIPLKTIKFCTPTKNVPAKIHIGLSYCHVVEYEEHPRQCSQCWLFGHGPKTCRSKVRCRICSGEHQEKACPNPEQLNCRNCLEEHPANDRNCHKLENERNILKIKNTQKISYQEAKLIFHNSYASKISPKQIQAKRDDAHIVTQSIHESVMEILKPIVVVIENLQKNQAFILEKLSEYNAPQKSSTASKQVSIPAFDIHQQSDHNYGRQKQVPKTDECNPKAQNIDDGMIVDKDNHHIFKQPLDFSPLSIKKQDHITTMSENTLKLKKDQSSCISVTDSEMEIQAEQFKRKMDKSPTIPDAPSGKKSKTNKNQKIPFPK